MVALVGPTASGKSAIAVTVAERLHGQVVSTDSMQAYQGMAIGTAVPTPAERRGVPHHLFEEWPIEHSLSVVEFRDRARAVIREVHSAACVPVVVGGSGLYVAAVLDAFDFPGTDPEVRKRWEDQLNEHGVEWAYGELRARDPEAAAEINPRNGRRIVRALEVNELTGKPFVARLPPPTDVFRTRRFGLAIDRLDLDARIERRVLDMWDAGFVAEVEGLQSRLSVAPTAIKALGYQPILSFLAGEISEQQAQVQTIEDTKKFARRQERWFRRDPRVEWWDYRDPGVVEAMVAAGTSE